MEVHSIPECKSENLAVIIIKIGQKISVDITSQDIDIVHRLRKKTPTTKPIIVRFTSYRKKREFYQSRFNLSKCSVSKLVKRKNELKYLFGLCLISWFLEYCG